MPLTAPMSNTLGSPAGSAMTATRRRVDPSHARTADLWSVEVSGLDRPIRVKIASERGEFEQAFRLLADRYKARGYDAPGAGEFRYTPYHALPGTVTFVAKDRDRVVATLTLVSDNDPLGLPMESIYGGEVAGLRRRGKALGEVISLAEEGLGPREFLRVFSAMVRVMFQYHVRRGGDTWVITVNPRHRGYYTKVLGFEPLGPCRAYSSVQDHPAEAFQLDLNRMRENVPGKFKEIFGEPLPRPVLTVVARPADYAWYFGSQSTQADCRTILGVLTAGAKAGHPVRMAATPYRPGAEGAEGATEACGSWRSKRCSPTAADY